MSTMASSIPTPLQQAHEQLALWSRPATPNALPLIPGAVGLLAHGDKIITTFATGNALRYRSPGEELPAKQRIPMRTDTIFDMASVTKLFTTIIVMQLVEQHEINLTDPVMRYVPEFAANGKHDITVQQLLTHTSGLAPFLPLWRFRSGTTARINTALTTERYRPGGNRHYSDLNFIALGVLAERCSGSPLDAIVTNQLTGPLGMTDTGFNPAKTQLHRIAATEYQHDPPRGMIHGHVHDENAYSLGGVAGHAGIFSTVQDITVLGQMLLNGGRHMNTRVLRPDTIHNMFTDRNQENLEQGQGLGFELDRHQYMGSLSSSGAVGHRGYTGTSIVLAPQSHAIAILLTNRVHPSRSRGSIDFLRRMWAETLVRTLPVNEYHTFHSRK